MSTSKEAKRAQMFNKVLAELKLAPDSTDAHVLDAIGDLLQRERDKLKRSQDALDATGVVCSSVADGIEKLARWPDSPQAEVRRLRSLLSKSFTVPAEQTELARAYVAGLSHDGISALLDLDLLLQNAGLAARAAGVEALSDAGLAGYDLVEGIELLATQRDEARDNEANTMAQAGQFADERNEARRAAQLEVTRIKGPIAGTPILVALGPATPEPGTDMRMVVIIGHVVANGLPSWVSDHGMRWLRGSSSSPCLADHPTGPNDLTAEVDAALTKHFEGVEPLGRVQLSPAVVEDFEQFRNELSTAAQLAAANKRIAELQAIRAGAAVPDLGAAHSWLAKVSPSEHDKIAARIDAGGAPLDVLGEWAGELAVSAHLAGQLLGGAQP